MQLEITKGYFQTRGLLRIETEYAKSIGDRPTLRGGSIKPGERKAGEAIFTAIVIGTGPTLSAFARGCYSTTVKTGPESGPVFAGAISSAG